jgi:hypothetical protein
MKKIIDVIWENDNLEVFTDTNIQYQHLCTPEQFATWLQSKYDMSYFTEYEENEDGEFVKYINWTEVIDMYKDIETVTQFIKEKKINLL